MKSLLLKDTLVILNQFKIFLIQVVILILIPQIPLATVIAYFSVSLTISSISYDEQAKWDSLAATMPYSPMMLVGSKYCLGLLSGLFIGVLGALFEVGYWAIRGGAFPLENLAALAAALLGSLFCLSLLLPFMFWLGVEKGRLIFLFGTILIVVAGIASGEYLVALLTNTNLTAMFFLFTLATLLVFGLSLRISTRLYQKRPK